MLDAIRRNVAWRAIPIAAFVAGTAHLLVNLLLMPLIHGVSPQVIIQYTASLLLGSEMLDDISGVTILTGIVVHYLIALLLTLVIAIVVHRWGLLVGIIGGAILGAAFYGINLYTMTLFFPWYFAINGPVLLLSHIVFGAVAGGVYETLDRFDLPLTGDLQDV